MGQNRTTAGIVDQLDCLFEGEKPLRFVARDQIACEGFFHILDVTCYQQSLADVRPTNGATGSLCNIGRIKRLSSLPCKAVVDIDKNPFTAPGTKVPEFGKRLLKSCVVMIKFITE